MCNPVLYRLFMHKGLCLVNSAHIKLFVKPGWGERLKEERLRAGLKQEELAHRNTQRGYEQEKTAPDVRYLVEVEGLGLDVGYILTASPGEGDPIDPVLSRYWGRLSTENRAALEQLIRSLAGEEPRPTLHDQRSGYSSRESGA